MAQLPSGVYIVTWVTFIVIIMLVHITCCIRGNTLYSTFKQIVPSGGTFYKVRPETLFHRVEHSARYVLSQCSMGWNIASAASARSRTTVHSAHTLRLPFDLTSAGWPLSPAAGRASACALRSGSGSTCPRCPVSP